MYNDARNTQVEKITIELPTFKWIDTMVQMNGGRLRQHSAFSKKIRSSMPSDKFKQALMGLCKNTETFKSVSKIYIEIIESITISHRLINAKKKLSWKCVLDADNNKRLYVKDEQNTKLH